RADEQRTGKPGAFGPRDGVEIAARDACLRQHLLDERQHAADVIARREFGYDAAVALVQLDLRMKRLREQAAFGAVQRGAGLVAGGFDAQDLHPPEYGMHSVRIPRTAKPVLPYTTSSARSGWSAGESA